VRSLEQKRLTALHTFQQQQIYDDLLARNAAHQKLLAATRADPTTLLPPPRDITRVFPTACLSREMEEIMEEEKRVVSIVANQMREVTLQRVVQTKNSTGLDST